MCRCGPHVSPRVLREKRCTTLNGPNSVGGAGPGGRKSPTRTRDTPATPALSPPLSGLGAHPSRLGNNPRRYVSINPSKNNPSKAVRSLSPVNFNLTRY